MRVVAALLATLVAAVGVSSAGTAGSRRAQSRLVVLAASSLTTVFPKIDPLARYSFGGSDLLAAQIQQGAPVDVYAAASPKYPEQLYSKGLVTKPVAFASNTLVLITPAANPAGIRTVFDLARRPGIKLVIGDRAVPIGAYTRRVLTTLGLSGVLSRVVSNEQNVRDILAKVTLGEADAGFVYLTDAKTAPGKLKTIFLPARAQPRVRYELAVVKSSHNRKAAAAFVEKVLAKRGQKLLVGAGFGPAKGSLKK
jgi:molybdate transport system substrate-binding protein